MEKEYLTKEQIIRNKILREINSWKWFYNFLFTHYMNTDISIRKFAKETGISATSIHRHLKICKVRLAKIYGENWQDFVKEDFYKLNK